MIDLASSASRRWQTPGSRNVIETAFLACVLKKFGDLVPVAHDAAMELTKICAGNIVQ